MSRAGYAKSKRLRAKYASMGITPYQQFAMTNKTVGKVLDSKIGKDNKKKSILSKILCLPNL